MVIDAPGAFATKLKHLVVRRWLQVHLLEQPLCDQVDSI